MAHGADEAAGGLRPFRGAGASGDSYIADTVIICTGAQVRWLGISGEATFRGRGVSACATCDGFFYRDKAVVVIGGGNVAVTDALLLAKFARQVTLVRRDEQLNAEKVLQDDPFCRWSLRCDRSRPGDSDLHLRRATSRTASFAKP